MRSYVSHLCNDKVRVINIIINSVCFLHPPIFYAAVRQNNDAQIAIHNYEILGTVAVELYSQWRQ